MTRAALAALLLAGQAAAQEAPRLFATHCASCHALAAEAPPGPGPSLHGIASRPMGGDRGFGYSSSFEAARSAGTRWDEARLATFLLDPDEVVPGTWMSAPGLRRGEDAASLAAWLLRAAP